MLNKFFVNSFLGLRCNLGRTLSFAISAWILTGAVNAWADTQAVGYVTPTSITYSFHSVYLLDINGGDAALKTEDFELTVNRSDKDFAQINLGTILVPSGRYVGVRMGMDFSYKVKLDGVVYEGGEINGLVSGTTPLWSVGSTGSTANAVSTSAPAGGATTLVVEPPGGPGAQTTGDTRGYFSKPICLAKLQSLCEPGDVFMDATQPTTLPNVSLLVDLMHNINVNPSDMTVSIGLNYPIPVLGPPGAAIHLFASNTDTQGSKAMGDISLLFDGNKELVAAKASSFWVGGTGQSPNFTAPPLSGVCLSADGYENVTKAPPGAYQNMYGPSPVLGFQPTTGKVQFPVSDAANASSPRGMFTVANALQQVGQTTAITCVADADADPPFLGYAYPSSGSGVPGTTAYTVVRIVDPQNIFGQCSATAAYYMPGSAPTGGLGGSCSSYYPSSTDGFK